MRGLLVLLAFAALAAPVLAQCQNGSCRVPARSSAKPRAVQQRASWYPGALLRRGGR